MRDTFWTMRDLLVAVTPRDRNTHEFVRAAPRLPDIVLRDIWEHEC